MIRVVRGNEPAEVRAQRERNLPLAITACQMHGLDSEEFKATVVDYDAGKSTLFFRQHEKCAYCERKPGLLNQPLEHFRPKLEAWRHLPSKKNRGDEIETKKVDRGYWWLAWTWENQFFACTTCNGRATKANYFPLEHGGSLPFPDCTTHDGRVPEESCDLAAESPLLLDPGDPEVDPIEHLQWHPTNHLPPPRMWTWTLCTHTDRGLWTRVILDLDALTNEVNDRYTQTVWPRFDGEVLRHRSNPTTARDQWRALGKDILTPRAPFAAATWWQLEALRRNAAHLVLQLPKLPRPRPPTG